MLASQEALNRSSEYNLMSRKDELNDQKSPRKNIIFGSSGPQDTAEGNGEVELNNTTKSGQEI